MKWNLPCVFGISVFFQVIAQAQSSPLKDDSGPTRADANLIRTKDNATFTQRVDAARVMVTTPQTVKLKVTQSSRRKGDSGPTRSTRVDTNLTRKKENTKFTQRYNATRVMATTPQMNQLKARSSRPISYPGDTRFDAKLTRRIEKATSTQRTSEPSVMGTTSQTNQLKMTQSSRPINDPAYTTADAYLTQMIEKTTYTQRFDEISTMGTTPQADQPKTESELKDETMKNFDPTNLQKNSIRIKLYLECAEETGVSPETILFLRSGIWDKYKPALKAWVHCVLVKYELMTDQGVLRLDVAFRNLTNHQKTLIEENIDKCLPTKQMEPQEISWIFAKCFQKEDPENSLF